MGSALSTGRVALRNLVKVLPWQFGHMAVTRFPVDEQLGMTVTGVALASLVAVAGPPLVRRRGVHDVVAGTVVRSAVVHSSEAQLDGREVPT